MEKIVRLAMVASLSTLAACSITVLPNGQPSGMDSEFNNLRMSLNVSPVVAGLQSSYLPFTNCEYTETLHELGMAPKTQNFSVSVKPVPLEANKLLVVTTGDDRKISTFLIDKYSGKLLDFNSVDPSSGQRFTPENYQQIANTDLADQPSERNPHLVNDFSLLMPDFITAQWNVNDVASYVNQEDGTIWAQYIYRGVTKYDGQDGELFDLVRIIPQLSTYGPIMVGFMIFDPTTMTPILSTLDAGSQSEVQRIGCSQ